jgi:hypothetical protein
MYNITIMPNKKEIPIVMPPINTTLNIKLMKIILAYSAINNTANPTDPYSKLNPDTNSDSPSAKSNGLRLVSANEETTHITIKGGASHINQEAVWCSTKVNKSTSE